MNQTLKSSIAEKFRNTPMGFLRIKRNLGIVKYSDSETETYIRKTILSTPLEEIETIGKNHYFKCLKNNVILTVNSHTFTIITAKQITNK